MIDSIIVLAKRPVPGRVKTRLEPALTPAQAATLAAAALADTLDVADRTSALTRILAFDGDPTGWVRPGWHVVAQPAGGLDHRLEAAFASAGAGSALLIGMDTPQIRPVQLTAFRPDLFDCCLGRAVDGGYWAIGFRHAPDAAGLIRGIPMSTPQTAAHQIERLTGAGLEIQELDQLLDFDTVNDIDTVAAAAPGTRFAAAARAVRPASALGAA